MTTNKDVVPGNIHRSMAEAATTNKKARNRAFYAQSLLTTLPHTDALDHPSYLLILIETNQSHLGMFVLKDPEHLKSICELL